MTAKTFRELLAQRPFQPFRLVMTNGQMYDVRHPEMAFVTQTDIVVGTGEIDEGVPADFKICSFVQIATIEPLGPSSANPYPSTPR